MNTKAGLEDWAKKNPGPRGDFATRVAKVLGNEREHNLWALVDIRREFESRPNIPAKRKLQWRGFGPPTRSLLTALGSVLPALYLLPVGFAWWHLSDVFGSFRRVARNLPSEVSVDFLTFWSKGYTDDVRAYDGWELSKVAFSVVAITFAIAILSVIFSSYESLAEKKAPYLDNEINNLILEATLVLGRSRAVRPEEIADVLADSGKKLKEGIDNLKEALAGTEVVVERIGDVSSSLVHSSGLIDSATRGLKDSLDPLVGFVDVARSAEQGFRLAGDHIRGAADEFSAGVRSNIEGFRDVVISAEKVSATLNTSRQGLEGIVESSRGVTGDMRDIGGQIADLAVRMNQINDGTTAMVERLDDVIAKVGVYTASLDDPRVQPYAKLMYDSSQAVAYAVDQMRQMIEHVESELAKLSNS